jgi:hypothetical protein
MESEKSTHRSGTSGASPGKKRRLRRSHAVVGGILFDAGKTVAKPDER